MWELKLFDSNLMKLHIYIYIYEVSSVHFQNFALESVGEDTKGCASTRAKG